MFSGNYGSVLLCFDILKMLWPWNTVRGHSMSSKLVPFYSLPMVSYCIL